MTVGKSASKIYQKKTQLEHILLRPDSYIGSIEPQTETVYVFDKENSKMKEEEITYIPGLYKIFDEILVNAADNKVRDKKMSRLEVTISYDPFTITVLNNGEGIPIEIHEKYNEYIPEMIFGHLLTSSNYDDNVEKITGGRNGFGAKLCNIFSSKFIVECQSKRKFYKQIFSKSMSEKSVPEIKTAKGSDFTKITFTPDLKLFKTNKDELTGLVKLIERRVYDMAILQLRDLKFNGEHLPSGFLNYVNLFDFPVKVQEKQENYEVFFSKGSGHVSFVNNIYTRRGGTHINAIYNDVGKKIIEMFQRRQKKTLTMKSIKNNLFLFVHSYIGNPTFDSQLKENMTLNLPKAKKFQVEDKLVNKVYKMIEDELIQDNQVAVDKQMKKSDGKMRNKLNINGLDDANWAGTKKSNQCSLILTEGLSAKTIVSAGFSVVGRDRYGVFPLKGKLLNVREATSVQLQKNVEIANIKRIIGLKHGTEYTSTENLRYSKVIIMTDQDYDGSHIKGLIINFFHHFFPSLLKLDFLKVFITPIVKVTQRGTVHNFYTQQEALDFINSNSNITKIKYYKGLGSSNNQDAKEYFSNLDRHIKSVDSMSIQDSETIELAFSKKKVLERKDWLARTPQSILDNSLPNFSITDFINKELIHFSRADSVRSIPSVIDGLKPGQRKILFACFKKNINKEIKVNELSGIVSTETQYHHGEMSLHATIINMAQQFIGSNNINLLVPEGQFGTRIKGGKDSASPRYIKTYLNPIVHLIFPKNDLPLLNYIVEENKSIEPDYYVPIIPLVLVNGAEGIGTGYSTNIPAFNPIDIIDNVISLINRTEVREIHPYYRNYTGEIKKVAEKKYEIHGVYEYSKKYDLLKITELPVGSWTERYKDMINEMVADSKISDYNQQNTHEIVYFEIFGLKKPSDFERQFKLVSSANLTNMVCFNRNSDIESYSVEGIFKEHFQVRYDLYRRRREYDLARYLKDLNIAKNRIRFINEYIEGLIHVTRRRKDDIVEQLVRREYSMCPYKNTYDYLLNMPIVSLTIEKIEELDRHIANLTEQYDTLYNKTVEIIWKEELETLREAYIAFEESNRPDTDIVFNIPKRRAVKKNSKKTTTAKAKRIKYSTYDQDSSSEE